MIPKNSESLLWWENMNHLDMLQKNLLRKDVTKGNKDLSFHKFLQTHWQLSFLISLTRLIKQLKMIVFKKNSEELLS